MCRNRSADARAPRSSGQDSRVRATATLHAHKWKYWKSLLEVGNILFSAKCGHLCCVSLTLERASITQVMFIDFKVIFVMSSTILNSYQAFFYYLKRIFNLEWTLSGHPDSYRPCLSDISVYHRLITNHHKASCVVGRVCFCAGHRLGSCMCLWCPDSLSVRETERLKRLSEGLSHKGITDL